MDDTCSMPRRDSNYKGSVIFLMENLKVSHHLEELGMDLEHKN